MLGLPGRILLRFLLVFLLMAGPVAQAASPESLGLGMVDVGTLDPSILHDIKYATPDNFTGQVLYPSARCLLREPVAYRLLLAQRKLRAQGLGLKVFDCYRPIEVQRKMWAVFPDEDFVANPASGSRHNRGASVDVGLVDASGREMPMPSRFDEFSERSHLGFMNSSPEQLRNRQALQEVMRQAGFMPVLTEWWHFDAPDWRDYSLSDADSRLVPANSMQVLAVAAPRPGTVESALWGFEKTARGWEPVMGPVPVTVGRAGFASFGGKREGDGMTPRGIYALGPVFGFAASADTRMPYRQATEADAWVDDPESPRYNQWVHGIPLHESHEKMRSADGLYRLGVVVGYNTGPVVPGRGSAIFMHIWRGPGQATSGCIALEEKTLERIVAWLNPDLNPSIILGFRGE